MCVTGILVMERNLCQNVDAQSSQTTQTFSVLMVVDWILKEHIRVIYKRNWNQNSIFILTQTN
jgi:hypothetical protein